MSKRRQQKKFTALDERLMREYLEQTGQKADFAPIGVLRLLHGLEAAEKLTDGGKDE